MELNITINMNNAAFDENPEVEVSRILAELAERIGNSSVYGASRINDINGNLVGRVAVIED